MFLDLFLLLILIKTSLVFSTKLPCLFAISFKWEFIYSDILYDSDPQSEIIGRPGGVLLSIHVLTGLSIFGNRSNFLVCDLVLPVRLTMLVPNPKSG